eukprot:CAMPEP_0118879026 /NCGR_PEP_ID=MMETSP1163-20130328/18883_1 /TAXON_ID=124430 /ORGANISM="Phaeomonas parva, Strain CCMP2877" /LENGTH=37 /DNA_ID= /DNA_START= /DNA_END= /DNA_ORIENTATION=
MRRSASGRGEATAAGPRPQQAGCMREPGPHRWGMGQG